MIEFWSELYDPLLSAQLSTYRLCSLIGRALSVFKLHRYILLNRFPGRFVRYFAASNN